VSWKLSRTVLRGGTNSNVGPLLGMWTGKAKQPYCFEVGAGEFFAFAGIWDRWRDGTGKSVETCSILTTTPNSVTTPVHDRMPVILDPDCYDLWLDPEMRDVGAASELVKPFDARPVRCYPVSAGSVTSPMMTRNAPHPWNLQQI
jgi:putative SOS response-associated peptidase YedK